MGQNILWPGKPHTIYCKQNKSTCGTDVKLALLHL